MVNLDSSECMWGLLRISGEYSYTSLKKYQTVDLIFSIHKTLLKSEKNLACKMHLALGFWDIGLWAWVTFTICKQTETYENHHNTPLLNWMKWIKEVFLSKPSPKKFSPKSILWGKKKLWVVVEILILQMRKQILANFYNEGPTAGAHWRGT